MHISRMTSTKHLVGLVLLLTLGTLAFMIGYWDGVNTKYMPNLALLVQNQQPVLQRGETTIRYTIVPSSYSISNINELGVTFINKVKQISGTKHQT